MYTFVWPKHPCPTCKKTAVTSLKLADVHDPCTPRIGSLFKCVDCALMFPDKLKLAGHRWKDHLTKPFTCTKCALQFVRRSDATKHFNYVHQCNCQFRGCSLVFDTKEQLRQHVASAHSAPVRVVELQSVPNAANAHLSHLSASARCVPAASVTSVASASSPAPALPFPVILPEQKDVQADDLQMLLELLKHCDVCDGYFLSDNLLNAHEALHQKRLASNKSQSKPQKAVAPLIPDPPDSSAGLQPVSQLRPSPDPMLTGVSVANAETQAHGAEQVTAGPSPLRVLAAAQVPIHISIPETRPPLPSMPIFSTRNNSSIRIPGETPFKQPASRVNTAAQMIHFPGALVTKLPGSSHFMVALQKTPNKQVSKSRITSTVAAETVPNIGSDRSDVQDTGSIAANTRVSVKASNTIDVVGKGTAESKMMKEKSPDPQATPSPPSSQTAEPEIIILNDDDVNDDFWN